MHEEVVSHDTPTLSHHLLITQSLISVFFYLLVGKVGDTKNEMEVQEL